MNTINKRAHEYVVAHQNKADGVALMRAYTTGAKREIMKRYHIHTKVFVSGKVSDLPYLVAYGNFANAERTLASMGYEVVNPMKICKKHESKSKPTIRYMTPEEEMRYLISTKNDK